MKYTRRKIELIILGVLLIILYVYAGHFERTHIYYPEKAMPMTPAQYGLKYDDITLITKDHVNINAWYVPTENPIGTLLFCHGNAGNDSDRVTGIDQFHHAHLNVFIFDYRGYGESEGQPSEQGTYNDAMAAYSYLTSRTDVDAKKIFIYGESLGGAVAIDLASKVKSAGLIVIDTFTSIDAIGREIYPFLPIRWLMRTKYDSLSKIKKIHCPVLIGHSKEDDIIPYHHGQDLFKAANPPKEFMQLKGNHGEAIYISDGKTMSTITDFIRESSGKSSSQ